ARQVYRLLVPLNGQASKCIGAQAQPC
ncbi:MAG: hypothetical protein RLZZ213_1316, partial [Cyanobacteriota bacterium]